MTVQTIDERRPACSDPAQRHEVQRIGNPDAERTAQQNNDEVRCRDRYRERLTYNKGRRNHEHQSDNGLEDAQCKRRNKADGLLVENNAESP